jgi:hypothetical protein
MQSMTIIVSVIIAIVSGETELYQSQRWVTKILYDTLESYVPDGGPACKRDGQAYREGLKDLRLWATQSEFSPMYQYNIIIISYIYDTYIWIYKIMFKKTSSYLFNLRLKSPITKM